ncbi:xanthine dehydrogenase, molybdenum binding subunit apoprotein [Paenibacillus algorifonticola]|uniref:Xanthine dehydrogenase, molybdenum binding subunit apoprotein n=1 Tax=Paenibacillus algorifonticola TaxID=684063 RepID=A0A1I1YHW0_9BACL|nr:xanthine dehydrogenase subunit D [Paenibacillus algorifonticola]SFE19116.1 xanthine dehydrogenase, molybdenum binding subunit apoprotein [Paenibacillus algorifonticola]
MLLNRETSGKRWRIRPDGLGKVTGSLAYLTDMSASGMLYGRVLRSPHPHALILSICTEKAKQLEGVHAVLTHLDVPGLNRYGIAHQDQPVFCENKVRYVGDAVAAVAAETAELAEYALSLIEVDYELLPIVDDAELALSQDAPLLHPQGNVLHRSQFSRGQLDSGFAACSHIVEDTYFTPRQMHTYMETEGGLFVPEEDGRLTVYSPTQHGFMDRLQLSRIAAMKQERIRIVSSPIGGSFGGKDELNVQPYGALLALKTNCPVKLHHSRWESVRAGLKRHPMKIAMKTGTDASGRLLAHQVRIIADTGAYATLGAEVLNFTVEHVLGPYRYEHVEVDGYSVYTNNGMSGEFRGFGGNQAIFALEGQLDRLAEKLGMDPWELRRLNMRMPDDSGPFGQPVVVTEGAMQVWNAAEASGLWRERSMPDGDQEREPWIKVGIGSAFTMHGGGLGVGIPDPAGGRLSLAADGCIEAIFGYEEFGQGLLATLELMLIEQFGLAESDIRMIIGDTDLVPDSGSTTASRATSMMWKTLQNLKAPFTSQLLERAAVLLGKAADMLVMGAGGIYETAGRSLLLTYKELAEVEGEPISCSTAFQFPTSDTARTGAHFLYTYAAVVVKVEINQLTGRVKVLDQYHAVAAGPVMNPQGFLGQIEGGSSMALGFTVTEDAVMQQGQYMTKNLDTYLVPTIAEHRGTVTVEPIEHLPQGDSYGPRGIGEVGSVTLAPAIAAAIYKAVGIRVTKLPIEPELLQNDCAFAFAEEAVSER